MATRRAAVDAPSASGTQIKVIKFFAAYGQIVDEAFKDRLASVLAAHEESVKTPGARSPLTPELADQTIEFMLDRATVLLAGPARPSDQKSGNGKRDYAREDDLTAVGVYKKDGTLYVVQANANKTHVYAMEVVGSRKQYRPGVVRSLTDDLRVSPEEAQQVLASVK